MNLLEEANGNPYGINSYIFNVKVYYPDDVDCFEEEEWEQEAYSEQEALECVQEDVERTHGDDKVKIELVKTYHDCYVTDAYEQGMYAE